MDQRKIWPNLSLASAEAIKQTQSEIHLADIKMPKKKKKNFYCIFNPNFYHVTTVFMASKISFRPNLLDLIFFLILPLPWHFFGLQLLYAQNQQKWLNLLFRPIFQFIIWKLFYSSFANNNYGCVLKVLPKFSSLHEMNFSFPMVVENFAMNSKLNLQMCFGLYWGCLEADSAKCHAAKFSRL